MIVKVLRLSHRKERDKRITTHSGLVARAFGADEIIYTGQKDENFEKSIINVSKKWGGKFSVKYEKSHLKAINEYKKKGFKIIHLTMYGLELDSAIKNIKNKDLLIIIGGEKVPREVYELSDYNISITNQPQSEVAALAIILKALELKPEFDNFELKIKPSNGKKLFN